MKLITITLAIILINTNVSSADSLDGPQELEIYNSLILARKQINHLEKEIIILRKTLLINEKKNTKNLIASKKTISTLLKEKENWIAQYEKLKQKKENRDIITFFAGAEGSHLELDLHLGLEFKPIKRFKLYIKAGGRNNIQEKTIQPYYRFGIGYELGVL